MRTVEEILADMAAIITAAAGRSLTAEECDRYEALERDLQAARRHAEITARHAAYAAPASDVVVPARGADQPDQQLEQAFEAFMRSGRPNADIADLQASQSEGTGSEGGYTVPPGFRQKLVDRMKAFGGIANVVEQVTTTNGNPLPWPTLDDTSNEGEIVEEGGTFVGGADLTFDEASLSAYEYATCGASAAPLRVSWVLLNDAAFDLQGLVSRKLGQRIARIQSTHLITGTGVKQPLGITRGLTGTQSAANTGITYADLLTYIHAVDPAYRENARWAFNDTSLKTIEQLVDSNGDPLWRSIQATIGDAASNGRLLGYPITIDQGFPDLDPDSATVNWGAFGDLQEGYVLRRVRDFALVVNPYTRASYRQTEYSAYARMDATRQNTNAYVALTCHA